RVAAEVLADPAVSHVAAFIGIDGENPTLNVGRMLVALAPLESRDASADEVGRRLARIEERIAGVRIYAQPVQDLSVEDRVSRARYQLTLGATDPDQLTRWTPTDRKSTRLNSSHVKISYAVFCLKKKRRRSRTGRYSTTV